MAAVDNLSNQYQNQHGWSNLDISAGFDALYVKYVRQRKEDIIDSIAVGYALEIITDGDEVDIDGMPDNVRQAFEQAFPNVPIETLNERSPEELGHLVNAWKGKLFEVEVQDQLNAGLQVGDWQLENGQRAELAESATQPGWDLKIVDEDGQVVDTFQLKSTDSDSYINYALERYPDVPIVATSDIANHADESVSVANISNEETTSQVNDVISGSDSVSDTLLQSTPAVIIAAMEWLQVRKGKKTTAEAVESGGKRLMLSAVAGLVGAAATAIIGPVGILGGVAARYWLGEKVIDYQNTSFSKYEKEINPRLKLSNREKPVSKSSAKKAFKELENITDRLRLEYNDGTA